MLTELWSSVLCHLYIVLRPMFKWILRNVTGKCELLRITHEEEKGAVLTKRIEKSLKQSRLPLLKQISISEHVDTTDVVPKVMTLKGIIPEVYPNFQDILTTCIQQICGYKRLLTQVEEIRKEKYNSSEEKHEEKLMQLWNKLMPNTPLDSRISKQWMQIGFQGDDPATDFRGMGILGLDQLIYFIDTHPEVAQSLLQKSHHPKYGYSYAILGINFTGMAYELLRQRKLRTHFYNLTDEGATLKQFNDVYCYLIFEFVHFWVNEKPRDIMEFGRLRDKFEKKVVKKILKKSDGILRTDFRNNTQE